MGKPIVLDEKEVEILTRNGIDPESKSVTFRTEDTIHLINHKTRDEIWIRQGDKNWDSY